MIKGAPADGRAELDREPYEWWQSGYSKPYTGSTATICELQGQSANELHLLESTEQRINPSGSRMSDTDFSELLKRVEASDDESWDQLMGLVYSDLKRIAHGQMARITPGQTLSTTVLVHETFEKLAAQGGLPVNERSAFYALCACAMRQIIIDHYRKRSADKRSPDLIAAADHETRRVTPDIDNALIDLGRALDLLAHRDERLLRAFEMRYFGGLSDADISARMDMSIRSVQRLVARARSWVATALNNPT